MMRDQPTNSEKGRVARAFHTAYRRPMNLRNVRWERMSEDTWKVTHRVAAGRGQRVPVEFFTTLRDDGRAIVYKSTSDLEWKAARALARTLPAKVAECMILLEERSSIREVLQNVVIRRAD